MQIPAKFDKANSFSEGLACVFIGDAFGFIDKSGKIIVKPVFDRAGRTGGSDFSEGLAVVMPESSSREGYIDKTGKMVIQPRFEYGEDFSEEMALVSEGNERLSFIDKTGKVIISSCEAYELLILTAFKNGLAMVHKNGKRGFINKRGELVIPLQFDLGQDFKDGLALVCTGDTCGYIDTSGEYVWQTKGSKMIRVPYQ